MKKQHLILGTTLLLAVLGFAGLGLFGKSNLSPPLHMGPQASTDKQKAAATEDPGPSYTVDPARWGISKDGTNAAATTKGINDALQWAAQNGYKQVILQAGTYLVDKSSRINMVSNMTFILDEQAVIRKETNGMERYETVYIGPDVKNVTLRNGTYLGDRDTHDYSSGGTHEAGYGIFIEGGEHIVIDGVKAGRFTGDAIYIAGHDDYVATLDDRDMEPGGIDDNGRETPDSGKIRSANPAKTNLDYDIFQTRKAFQLARPKNIAKDSRFDIFFYRADGTYIGKAQDQEFYYSDIPIPADAHYYRAVFTRSSTAGVEFGTYAQVKSKDVTVRNSDISFNRRQGITVCGADQVLIENNTIHDIQGTAPESGIDLEGGYFPNSNIRIVKNTLYNNKAYDVILFDGRNAVVDGNRLESKDAVGLTSTPLFKNGTVTNNVFTGSQILVIQHLTFKNNKMTNGWAKFIGPDVTVKGMDMTDSTLIVESSEPNGVAVEDVKMVNHRQTQYALVVNGSSVRLTNVAITGPPQLRSISGNAAGLVFDRLKITDFNGKYGLDLPPGVYKDCVFASDGTGELGPEANKAGKYEFTRCTFKTAGTGLNIVNPDAEVTLQDSQFDISASLPYGKAGIYVQAAKKISILRNTINARHLEEPNAAIIKINTYGAANKVSDVAEVAVEDNKIHTNLYVPGISTTDAGIGAPPYVIKNNSMENAGLELREVDKAR
jgi:hypothetical protein